MNDLLADSAALVHALARRLRASIIETHISWVLLAPAFAYKVKKPVRLGFLDYSTLQRRRHFCAEELRVNRRMAPSLYLGLARITGTPEAPELDGDGPLLDYAVRMRRFPAGALFSERLAAGRLSARDVDSLAAMVAAAQAAAPASLRRHSDPHRRALAALEGARPLLRAPDRESLRAWLDAGARELAPVWRARRRGGHVRECHGDLHLANVLDLAGHPAAFDAIEFDAGLRWIDVAEDAAFAAMDFAARGRPDCAWRFLNAWLDAAGEHEAAPVLRYALVERALVRATVEHLRDAGSAPARRYAREALAWSRPAPPRLVITCGLPGSGKTFQSQRLVEGEGALRVRSDVERKRLHGLGALESSRARGIDIYSVHATEATYARLYTLAAAILRGGFTAVIDAAFLRRGEREGARAVARAAGVPFEILWCDAADHVLRARLAARTGDASEADASVLQALRAAAEPPAPDETPFVRRASASAPITRKSAS